MTAATNATTETNKSILSPEQITALPVTLDAVKSSVSIAIKSAETLRTTVQKAAVNCLISMYKGQEGSIIETNRLLTQLGKGVNNKTLIEWFKLLGCVLDEKQTTVVRCNKKVIELAFVNKLIRNVNGKQTIVNPIDFKWFDAKDEPEFKGMDLMALLNQIVKKNTKCNDDISKMQGDEKKAAQEMMLVTPEQMAMITKIIAA